MVAKQIISYVDLLICAFIGGGIIYVFFTGWTCFYSTNIQGKRLCVKKKIKPLAKNCAVPPLVGIMLMPFLVYNTAPSFFEGLHHPTNAIIRKATIGLVLFKAGLGLDLRLLKKVYRPILKLAFLPQLVEACVGCFFAVWLFNMPVTLAFAFGYLLAGGSTTVCVPLANSLQDQGYGVDKFIPTIIVLAVTIDAMFALTAVNFLVSLEYTSDNLFGSGPGAAVGLGLFQFFGSILFGVLLALAITTCFRRCDRADSIIEPTKTTMTAENFAETSSNNSPENSSESTEIQQRLENSNEAQWGDYFEFVVMLGLSMAGMFIPAKLFNMNNFGYVCTVIMNAFLRLFWKNSKRKVAIHSRLIGYLFFVGQFLLFGLIGTAIDIGSIDTAILVEIVIVIFACLFLRFGTAYFALGCCEQFKYKERLAVSLTWMAKATVQVALGGLVLDKEEELGLTDSPFGADFVGLSVFAILFCAPLGGILGGIFAKRWLTKKEHTKELSNDDIIIAQEDSEAPVQRGVQVD